MKLRIIHILLLALLFLSCPHILVAQTGKKSSADSAIAARKHILDSTKAARAKAMDSAANARKHAADSITAARKHKTDSLAKARKHKTDSTAAIKRYKESKKYRDSVERVKKKKEKTILKERQAKTDSIKSIRTAKTDSIASVRKTRTDSLRKIQKNRTDSLAKVKKYKASKRFTDSVTLVKRHRSDSIKTIQNGRRDSIAAIRKHVLDSTKTVRTQKLDSAKLARTKITDSLKLARKAKTDSLAKKKVDKTKVAKANEKKKLEAQKIKFELKLKQKREAWSNVTMLKKPWGPVRRLTQNSFTHYNYYYNAKRKLAEAEGNMLRMNKDNFDSLINLFSFDPNKDSSVLASDMDSVVRKASVGIQIHDPRIKWGDDMYLLLGQAYYYKGGYENAAISFRYIIANKQKNKNKKKKSNSKKAYAAKKTKGAPSIVDKKKHSKLAFWKHPSVQNDAILWLSRTYATAGQVENAEAILSLLEYDPDFPDYLSGRLALEKAYCYLKNSNYPEASKQLDIAVDDPNIPGAQRMRIAFLNGQLQQNAGKYNEAAASFEEVLSHYPKIEMDFYARKYIAYNKLMAGSSIAEATTQLKRMLKDGKYANQYDQVYYVLGKLEASNKNNEAAADYLTKSTTTPKATKKQKALSFAALGDVYYADAKYTSAKSAYDSAAFYAGTAGSKDKNIAAALSRSTGLSEVSGPLTTIHTQDSLLALARLPKKEQQSVARRYIKDLEKKRADSVFAAENKLAAALPTVEPSSDPSKPDGGSWYFSNPSLIDQGSADFKRKWGTRPLTDNWRRASASEAMANNNKAKTTDNTNDTDEDEQVGDDGIAGAESKNGIPSEERLLAKIPNTPAQKELAEKIIQKSYVLLAKAYTDQLQDYGQAIQALDTLCKRYPAHSQKEEELYLRYRIAIKQGKLDKAQEYANEILNKFPRSQYVNMLKPAKSESGSKESTKEVAIFFDETYAQLMNHQYTEARLKAEEGKRRFTHPVYKKRFEMVEAMAYGGAGDYDKADTIINKFIKDNPTDSLTDWAKAVKAFVADMRKGGGKPTWYKEGPRSAAAIAASTPPAAAPTTAAEPTKPDLPTTPPPPPAPKFYAYQPDSAHYVVITLSGLDSRTGPLKNALKSYSNTKFAEKGLQVIIDLYKMTEGVMLVKGLSNAKEALSYTANINSALTAAGYKADELKVMVISANNYKKLFADKAIADYEAFYNGAYNK